MPWTRDSQAAKHTKKAKSSVRKRQWREVANSVLRRTGDEGQAVRTANGVVKKSVHKKGNRKKVSKK